MLGCRASSQNLQSSLHTYAPTSQRTVAKQYQNTWSWGSLLYILKQGFLPILPSQLELDFQLSCIIAVFLAMMKQRWTPAAVFCACSNKTAGRLVLGSAVHQLSYNKTQKKQHKHRL